MNMWRLLVVWGWVCVATCTLSRIAASQDDAAAKTDEAASRQYAAAVALQNREVYDLAVEEWQAFVTKFPKDPRVDRGYHYLGICYLNNQQLEKALETFQRVLRDYPQFPLLESTYLSLGVTQYTLGRAGHPESLEQAAQTLTQLIAKYPQGKNVPQARFYHAETLYAQGKKDEAAAAYSQLLKDNPKHELAAGALYALGVSHQEMGRADQAGQSFTNFLKLYPVHRLTPEVRMRQGETLLSLKRFEEAEKLFSDAAATPNFAHADFATLQQGTSLAARGRHAHASTVYRDLIKKFPQSHYLPTALLELGKSLYAENDFAGAKEALARIKESAPEIGAEAAHWMVRCHLKEHHPVDALKLSEQALVNFSKTSFAAQLELDKADAAYEIAERRGEAMTLYAAIAAKYPKDSLAPQAAYMAAFAALRNNDYKQAVEYTDTFFKAYPGNSLEPDVTYIAAESRLQLHEYPQALDLYRRLIEKYPSHADAGPWKLRSVVALSLQKKYSEAAAAVEILMPSLKAPALIAEARYVAGSAQFELKQFDAAVTSLKASVQADPTWRQADETLLALAHAYRQLNNLNAAKTVLRKLVDTFPQSDHLERAQYRLGEYAYAAKDYNDANVRYRLVLEKWPQGIQAPFALHGLGWSQFSQNDFVGAVKTLTDLLARFPKHSVAPRASYARALAKQQLKEYAPAVEDLQAFLKTNPAPADAADAQYVLGLCLAALNQPAEAAATFQSLLKSFPEYSGADKTMYELAWALQAQGKENEAVPWFERVSTQHGASPLAAESLFQVGEFHYQQRDYQKAATYYDAAVKKVGSSEVGEKAFYKLGWSLYRLDRFDESVKTFAEQRLAYATGPLAADALFMQAESLFKQGKFADAIPLYAEVKNPNGKEVAALALLHAGQAAAQLKDWQRSLAILDQLVNDFPQTEYLGEALYEQGWAQQNLGKLDKALLLYRAVPDQTNRDVAPRAWYMSGEIYLDKKDYKEALRCFLKAAVGYNSPEWQANGHYQAGRCFEALNKKDQAIQSYQEVVAKHPQSDKARLAQQRLDILSKQ